MIKTLQMRHLLAIADYVNSDLNDQTALRKVARSLFGFGLPQIIGHQPTAEQSLLRIADRARQFSADAKRLLMWWINADEFSNTPDAETRWAQRTVADHTGHIRYLFGENVHEPTTPEWYGATNAEELFLVSTSRVAAARNFKVIKGKFIQVQIVYRDPLDILTDLVDESFRWYSGIGGPGYQRKTRTAFGLCKNLQCRKVFVQGRRRERLYCGDKCKPRPSKKRNRETVYRWRCEKLSDAAINRRLENCEPNDPKRRILEAILAERKASSKLLTIKRK